MPGLEHRVGFVEFARVLEVQAVEVEIVPRARHKFFERFFAVFGQCEAFEEVELLRGRPRYNEYRGAQQYHRRHNPAP